MVLTVQVVADLCFRYSFIIPVAAVIVVVVVLGVEVLEKKEYKWW